MTKEHTVTKTQKERNPSATVAGAKVWKPASTNVNIIDTTERTNKEDSTGKLQQDNIVERAKAGG